MLLPVLSVVILIQEKRKNKSCLYFSITFNWPVENAEVSLKFYKQTHHYVSHQFEEYLYRWQLSDTISTPLLFCLYNNTSIQKTDRCTLIYKASCFLIKFPSLLDLAMLVNFPDPPFNNWFILSILPKHIPRSKPQKNFFISLKKSFLPVLLGKVTGDFGCGFSRKQRACTAHWGPLSINTDDHQR